MPKIAYLTAARLCVESRADSAERREYRLQLDALRQACGELDLELCPVAWSEASDDDITGCDCVLIGAAWDYAERPAAFVARLECWSALRPVLNPLATVRWNMEKSYLRELEQHGVAIVPTLWRERAGAEEIRAAFDELGVDEIVVKPLVGQSSWRQVRLGRGAPLPPASALPPQEALIQPLLRRVQTEGELSFVCFGGELSHALRKRPAAGDYRTQASYGGREEPYSPRPAELELVTGVLATLERLGHGWLYARVDLLPVDEREWVLIELELIEPYFYPEQGGGAARMGRRFASALARALARF